MLVTLFQSSLLVSPLLLTLCSIPCLTHHFLNTGESEALTSLLHDLGFPVSGDFWLPSNGWDSRWEGLEMKPLPVLTV